MITVAIQKGSLVYVYGAGNHQLFSVLGELTGYTSTTVSVKKNGLIVTYNEKGSQISSHIAK